MINNKYAIRVKIIEEIYDDPIYFLANPRGWVGIENDDVYPIYSSDLDNNAIDEICEFLKIKLKSLLIGNKK